MEAGRVPAPLGPSVSLCLPTVCSAQAGLIESACFDWALVGSGDTVVAIERVVRRSFVPVGRQATRTSTGVALAGPTPCAEVPSRPRDPPASHMEAIQCLIRKAGLS